MTPYVHPQRMRARWMSAFWIVLSVACLVLQAFGLLPGWALTAPLVSAQVWLAAEWVLVTVRDWEDQ